MDEQGRFLVLAVNPGSTSTKIALFRGDEELFAETIRHGGEDLAPYAARPLIAQLDFRLRRVRRSLDRRAAASFDAVAGRGGLLKPLAGGTYEVNEAMLRDLAAAARGDHASNLGAPMARALVPESAGRAFIVDPVSVDEWPPVARLSGLAGLDRECLSHALNMKAVARRYARERGEPYASLRLVVAHLGSGVSVSAHTGGRMIDVTNSREEGAFSIERAGGLPAMRLVSLCFSGRYTEREIERRLFREGGVASYLGTKEIPEVLERIRRGDERARLVLDAMLYQIAKEIGAMAVAAGGRPDAILLTGGMIHAPEIAGSLTERVAPIAPVRLYPGEEELRALAEGALRVLAGEEEALAYE